MKSSYSRFNVVILTIILGILISMQFKNIEYKQEYASLNDIVDYKNALEKENAEIDNIKMVIEDYKNKIRDFNLTSIRDGDISKLLEEEIKEMKEISGYTDVFGPGVVVIIDDATRELFEGENPNYVLVHDTDILNIVNDLKIAGAEAISINNQRILSSTEIDCSGYTIEIDGVDYGHPYIIKAIGEPRHLKAAINGPYTYGYYLKEYGIFVEVNTVTYIKIPKYNEHFNYEYLKVEEGD